MDTKPVPVRIYAIGFAPVGLTVVQRIHLMKEMTPEDFPEVHFLVLASGNGLDWKTARLFALLKVLKRMDALNMGDIPIDYEDDAVRDARLVRAGDLSINDFFRKHHPSSPYLKATT